MIKMRSSFVLALLAAGVLCHPASAAPADTQIAVKNVTANFRRDEGKVLVKYPQFSGKNTAVCKKLNTLVQRAMNENAYHDLVEMTFSKTFVDTDSVSTGFTFFRRGGAHRNGFYVPLNYKLKPQIKKMSVEEFFGRKIDKEKLSAIVAKPMARAMSDTSMKESDFYNDLTAENRPFDGFLFDKDKVTFTFSNLGCNAFGVQSFEIPYKDLRGLFAASSPAYKYAAR
ncbi:MAG: DUF3298 domain-containing protein [Cyanobacteria bacterium SZAS LIN-3]|nr:DUF3298 domain-containing protein [Cyanobacteria bacterium SZAS LIN-3]MBS2011070.1 DUF3298 domain-containing protein [Cyanobacteria bacterium SZAS TMP-1]